MGVERTEKWSWTLGRELRRSREGKDRPMVAFRTVVSGLARGRMAAAESLLMVAVWLAVAVEEIATWLGSWLPKESPARLRGRSAAEGLVSAVIMVAFFAGLALLVGRMVGPAVTTRVTCTVTMLQQSSANPVPPTC